MAVVVIVFIAGNAFWLAHTLGAIGGGQLLLFALLMLPVTQSICAWNHHHHHCPTFRSRLLNRGYEFLLGFITAGTSGLWIMHHNLGHHRHYMTPGDPRDTGRWVKSDHEEMGLLEYVVQQIRQAYGHCFGPVAGDPLKGRVRFWFLLTLVLLLVLTLVNWRGTLILWGVWLATSIVGSSTATLWHHRGLKASDDPLCSSRNRCGAIYNFVTCNLGFHTAHHLNPRAHWSTLPALHAQIEHRIPAELIDPGSKYDVLWNGFRRRLSRWSVRGGTDGATVSGPQAHGDAPESRSSHALISARADS